MNSIKNENLNNYYNSINYTPSKNMSAINEFLLTLIPSDLIKNVLQFACPFTRNELFQQKLKLKKAYNVWNKYNQFTPSYYQCVDRISTFFSFESQLEILFKNYTCLLSNDIRFLESILKENNIRFYKTNQKRNLKNLKHFLYPNFC